MAQEVAQFVNPVLAALKRLGDSGRPAEVCAAVAHDMGLDGSPVLERTLKSGRSWFENKIAWVRQYFVLAGIIDPAEYGIWTLTEKGRNSKPFSDDQVNKFVLDMQRQDKIRRGKKVPDAKDEQAAEEDDSSEAAPEELEYKAPLLEIIRGLTSKGFEKLCQLLLRKSGFEEVNVTGRSGDGGIDGNGVLRVNPFVTLKVLFQCKKYVGAVGPSEVREFRGALHGRADKGIILTTGTFSAGAREEGARDGVPPIELVDGQRLAGLLAELELGVVAKTTYEVAPAFFSKFDSNTNNPS